MATRRTFLGDPGLLGELRLHVLPEYLLGHELHVGPPQRRGVNGLSRSPGLGQRSSVRFAWSQTYVDVVFHRPAELVVEFVVGLKTLDLFRGEIV